MNKKILIFCLLMLTINLVSAGLPVYVKPFNAGQLQPGISFDYIFNFTTLSNCSGVVLSNKSTMTTDVSGIGFTNINITSLSEVPSYMCEYKGGTLRKSQSFSDQIFRDIYAKEGLFDKINVTSNLNVENNATFNKINIGIPNLDGVTGLANVILSKNNESVYFSLIRNQTLPVETFIGSAGAVGLMGTHSPHEYRIRSNNTDAITVDTSQNVNILKGLLRIGDGTAGSKTLTFNAITDASIIWDETKFDFGVDDITTTGTITAEQLTSTDDITMLGHLLTLGDGSANDIIISLDGSAYDSSITFDESEDEILIDTQALQIHHGGANANSNIYLTTYNSIGNYYSQVRMRRSHSDTLGTLSPTVDGNPLGSWIIQGVGSTGVWRYGAIMRAEQNGAAGTYFVPTDLEWATSSSTTNHPNQFMIHHTGNIGINVPDPDEKLEVNGSVRVSSDNQKYYTGSSKDVSRTFNGSDEICNAEVGTPDYYFTNFGNVTVEGDMKITGTLTGGSPIKVGSNINMTGFNLTADNSFIKGFLGVLNYTTGLVLGTNREASLVFDGVDSLYTHDVGYGSEFLFVNMSVEISDGLLDLKANTTAWVCNATYEGSVYYDGGLNKHRGCNSTDWNSFY